MKVSELTGAKLDYWVAKAGGTTGATMIKGSLYHENGRGGYYRFNFRPSKNWLQGGPIIEREGIELVPGANGEQWAAGIEEFISGGDTPLIAAMRCFVASKFGEEVSDE